MGAPAVSHKRRLVITLACTALIFLLLIVRLFDIMIIDGAQLQEKALSQWTQDTTLTASRGKILDSTGVVLAQSGTAYKILIWPKRIDAAERERISNELALLLGLDYATVLSKVSDMNKQEIVLKRSVEKDVVDQVTAMKLGDGIGTEIDTKRYYPLGELFSQLLGFTTSDGVGQQGVEQKYDKYLAGSDGRMITETDRRGNALAYGIQEIIEPIDGYNIVLTTDSVVESFLEKALEEALEVNKATTAQGIVMECKTGKILAISTQPDYDPNAPPRSDIELLNSLARNRLVCDAYEPGSTFKIVTLAAALDSGTMALGSEFNCPGYHIVNGERIKCWKSGGHGQQNLKKAVQNSCNPAFMTMALSMGKETFYDYIYAFGFGTSTGSGISGEASGIVTHEKYVKDYMLARIGFGQSIAVTPIQLTAAAAAAVNGGKLMQPYAVDRIVKEDGELITKNEPTVVRNVISENTSAIVREILESVVSEGSGKNAAIPGYRVGGKTGTAQKYGEDGGIDNGKLIASFIGFAPADDPEYICLILVDEPQVGTIFGSTVAAPFVKNVLEETLRNYGHLPEVSAERVVVPDVTGMPVEAARTALREVGLDIVAQEQDEVTATVPAAGETVVKGTEVLLYTALTTYVYEETEETQQVSVPDVLNMTRLEANDALGNAGLRILIEPIDQKGKAIRQVPVAGTMVEPGTEVLVDFSDIELGNDPEGD